MKRSFTRILLGMLVALVVLFLGGAMYFDSRIKAGVEASGPKLTMSDVTLDAISLSWLTGAGRMIGLNVGNPAGFRDVSAIRLDSASMSLRPGSFFSDKLIVNQVRIEAAQITFEGTRSENNLRALLDNVNAVLAEAAEQDYPAAPTGRKMQVGEVLITGAHVSVQSPDNPGETVSLRLPDIRLTDLGTGAEGITSSELTRLVLDQLLQDTLATVGGTFPTLSDRRPAETNAPVAIPPKSDGAPPAPK